MLCHTRTPSLPRHGAGRGSFLALSKHTQHLITSLVLHSEPFREVVWSADLGLLDNSSHSFPCVAIGQGWKRDGNDNDGLERVS